MDIEIAKIRPFRDHPFKVVDDDKMQDLEESIRINGILSPVLIRPIGNDLYEMVSGHRRMHAAGILGMECVPAIIMTAAAGWLFFCTSFSGGNAVIVILTATALFWLPEFAGILLAGLASLQRKIADSLLV